MKHLLVLGAFLLAGQAPAGELDLEIQGQGLAGQRIRVAVYSAAESEQFPSGGKFYRATVKEAAGERLAVPFPSLPPGKYAVSAYADANGNGRLDRNFLGMPSEQYGFSNNARGRFGPPAFAEAAVELGDGTVTQTIHLQ
jgi:uncharacterized protein (DUF2141 family)